MNVVFGGALRRVAAALAGAVGASLLAAAFDAKSASASGGTPFGTTWVTALGLVAPLALALGFVAGVVRALLFSGQSRDELRRWSSPADPAERGERAVTFALAPPALLLWLLFSAGTALDALVSELETSPLSAGLSLGLSLFGLVLALGVVALARAFGGRVGRSLPAPIVTGAISACVSAALLLAIVLTGTPSGAGGPLALFGVLTREELDLRPVGLLGLIALGALVVPLPRSRAVALLLAAAAVIPPPLLLGVADDELEDLELSLAVERSAPLAGKLLGPLRRQSDRDRDGHAARFGGGDCDDSDPKRNPAADDIPGNGIDEDCSGADAKLVAKPAAAEKPEADAARARESLPEGLSVVLITIDTLRYDLGYMGAERPISPRLDQLAKESVVFERAYALASYTSKSLPPMLIGKYCSETQRGFLHFNRFNDKADVFLAERLTGSGVHTASFQGHWYFFEKFGMERGFATIDTSAAPKVRQLEGDRTSTSEPLSNAVIAELGKPGFGAKPFFIWAHYTDPHADYVPHEGFDFGSNGRARYDGEIAYVDHHVGRVLDALRASPLWDKTAVIVTSDHGEAFGEHGLIRHGFELWEELVRVPLLVRVPGVPPKRVQVRRSLIDIAPTVLDLYRLPQPEGADAFSGQSLLPDLLAKDPSDVAPRPILVDMPQGPYNDERSAFIDGDLKLVTAFGRPVGLYDLAQDPGEKVSLLKDKERTRAALDAYKAFRRNLREVYVRSKP